MASGYTTCSCRDCFEITVANNVEEPELCDGCDEAECAYTGEDCRQPGAYGSE